MTAGQTTFSLISANVNTIIDASLAVARMSNVLLPTVSRKGGVGLANRRVEEYNSVTFVQVGEDDDSSPQQFTKDTLATLTPAQYRAMFEITDARVATDYDDVLADAAQEFGGGAGQLIDTKIASNFSSLTGGTIGAAGTAITWAHITKGHALLMNQGVPAGSPVFCALHPYQWEVLLRANTIAGASVSVAPGFQDQMSFAPNFFQIPAFQGIIFVITNNIAVDASNDAYGAIYVPQAFIYDERKSLGIEPERNASREATELVASMWFAHGVYRPAFGVALLTDASTPSIS